MTVLDQLRILLGEPAASRFLALFSGTSVTFPKRLAGPFFAALVRAVGSDLAERVCRQWAGEHVYIPRNAAEERARRNVAIAARLAAGESPESIARSFHEVKRLSVRTVRRIAKQDCKTRHLTETHEAVAATVERFASALDRGTACASTGNDAAALPTSRRP